MCAHNCLDVLLYDVARFFFARQEEHADTIVAGGGQADAEFRGRSTKERMRQLQQDAGAIARSGIAPYSAAMVEIREKRERVRNDRVRSLSPQVRDESHPASIMLERRVIEPLRRGLSARLQAAFFSAALSATIGTSTPPDRPIPPAAMPAPSSP